MCACSRYHFLPIKVTNWQHHMMVQCTLCITQSALGKVVLPVHNFLQAESGNNHTLLAGWKDLVVVLALVLVLVPCYLAYLVGNLYLPPSKLDIQNDILVHLQIHLRLEYATTTRTNYCFNFFVNLCHMAHFQIVVPQSSVLQIDP